MRSPYSRASRGGMLTSCMVGAFLGVVGAVEQLELEPVGVFEGQHGPVGRMDVGECVTRLSANQAAHASSSARLSTFSPTWSPPVRVG
jgi:hypothetical protein